MFRSVAAVSRGESVSELELALKQRDEAMRIADEWQMKAEALLPSFTVLVQVLIDLEYEFDIEWNGGPNFPMRFVNEHGAAMRSAIDKARALVKP